MARPGLAATRNVIKSTQSRLLALETPWLLLGPKMQPPQSKPSNACQRQAVWPPCPRATGLQLRVSHADATKMFRLRLGSGGVQNISLVPDRSYDRGRAGLSSIGTLNSPGPELLPPTTLLPHTTNMHACCSRRTGATKDRRCYPRAARCIQ